MDDTDPRYDGFPPGFFARADESRDDVFYRSPRLVTHIDDGAIAAVGRLYTRLGVTGRVLDLMGSWVSHFERPPAELTVLGMNAVELEHNAMATRRVVHDLNLLPRLPFAGEEFDDVTCCVSVDYLVRPIEVFEEVARVVRPAGRFVCTFGNRCFPTKAIRGWLAGTDGDHCTLVAEYFRRAGGWGEARAEHLGDGRGDPLIAVWAPRA